MKVQRLLAWMFALEGHLSSSKNFLHISYTSGLPHVVGWPLRTDHLTSWVKGLILQGTPYIPVSIQSAMQSFNFFVPCKSAHSSVHLIFHRPASFSMVPQPGIC